MAVDIYLPKYPFVRNRNLFIHLDLFIVFVRVCLILCASTEISTMKLTVINGRVKEVSLSYQSGTYAKKTFRKPSEQLFPKGWPLSYPILTKI